MEQPSAPPGPPEAPGLEARVAAERVRLLFAKLPAALATVAVNGPIVALVLWASAPRGRLLAWVAGLLLISAGRLALRAAWRRRPGAVGNAAWARRFTAGAALNGLAWGLLAPLFFPSSSLAIRVFLAFVLGGMTAGAAGSASSHLRAYAAFAVPALAPAAVQLLLADDLVQRAMGIMLLVFGAAVTHIARSSGQALATAWVLRFHNEQLAAHLATARDGLAILAHDLERRVVERTADLERSLLEQRRAELVASRFRALLDQAGAGIFVAEVATLRVVDANAVGCRMVGRDREELVGASLSQAGLDPALDEGQGWRELWQALPPGGTHLRESSRTREDGSVQVLETTVSARRFEDQDYLLVALRDVSERKEMERQLTRTRLLASMGTLAAGMAHEINNPLACVAANLQWVSGEIGGPAPDWGEARAALAEAAQAAERIATIVRGMAATTSGLGPPGAPSSDLGEVLASCLSIAQREVGRRAHLVHELGPLPRVAGDRARLSQLFLNLLVNAAQAIPPGPADHHQIRLVARWAGGTAPVVVEVSDSGVGIPPAHLDRVFEPFFTTRAVGEGAGLGLTICHDIVSSLGGRISVRSMPGKGSVFAVELPAAAPTPAPVAD
jgi:PAS domain S-box-containing protein